MKLKQLIKRN